MLGAIRRVISGDDVHGSGQQPEQQQQQGEPQQAGGTPMLSGSPPQLDSQEGGPAVVMEYSDHDAPVNLIAQRDRNGSDNFTANSSLSDASAQGDDDTGDFMDLMKNHTQVDVYMEDILVEGSPTPLAGVGSGPQQHQHPPTHYQQHLQQQHHHHHQQHLNSKDRIQRMESDGSDSGSARATTTSQNSSRDWGWFDEDVHLSGHLTPTGSLKNTRHAGDGGSGGHGKLMSRKSKNESLHRMVVGLDPKDAEAVAAAMAVTAPTYVLEESRSSQLLWKDSAGRRPPQPLEERAFYEKMWAQNFAKSQVNYQMPVEVLTATTPISLSPFAEGPMDIPPLEENFDGGNYQQYNMNVNNPAGGTTGTHAMMMPSSLGGGAAAGNSKDAYGGGDEDTRTGGLKETPRPAPPSVLPPTHQQHIVNKIAKTESGENLTVLVRGDNVFGTTVSKSFALSDEMGGPITGVETVNISIASYRVVESRQRGKYAQFLVIYREGSIRDTMGVWKRYSDFDDLAKKVTQAHEGCASVIANMSPLAVTEEHDVEHLPNAITSWRLLKKRQRWYRCLDSGYLSLKVFLLERFLHDILFESSSPKLLREFVGIDRSSR